MLSLLSTLQMTKVTCATLSSEMHRETLEAEPLDALTITLVFHLLICVLGVKRFFVVFASSLYLQTFSFGCKLWIKIIYILLKVGKDL